MYPKEGQLTWFFHGFIFQQWPLWTFTLQAWGRPSPAVGVSVCEFYLACKFFPLLFQCLHTELMFKAAGRLSGQRYITRSFQHDGPSLSHDGVQVHFHLTQWSHLMSFNWISTADIFVLLLLLFSTPQLLLDGLVIFRFPPSSQNAPWGESKCVIKESTVTLALAFFPPTQ